MVYGHLDSVKFQLDQEGPLPSIIMGKLQQSKNHQESEIKYDSEHNVIYILTYQRSEDRSITDSTLYSSVLTDISFTPIELKYKYGNFVFTKIEVGTKIIVGFSEIRDVIAISINFGKDWEVLNLMFGGVNEIVINPDNSHFISILTKLNKVYIVKGLGEQISFHSNNGIKLIWSSNSEYLYYISESFENNKISLFITKYDDYLPSNLLSGVIDFGKIDNIIWAVTKDNKIANLHIIENEGVKKFTKFPRYLKPSNYNFFLSNSQIYTIVKNETNEILLYSASLRDLRFTRIGETLRSSYNLSIEPCIPVETFDPLPGVLIMNKETTFKEKLNLFTAISYNYGFKWTHIVPPKVINDLPCIWPSCYLKLTLECQKNKIKNSIRFSKKSPSLMISYGIIFRNEEDYYSGLFLSLDAGYTWEQIPSPINSVHILNYGSILLGLPTILYSFYYSYDLGHTWKFSTLEGNSLIPIKIFPDSSSSLLLTTIITLNENTKEWGFIKIDFTKTLKKECHANDYEAYTPGLHDQSACFQGQKGFTYRRKHPVRCKSLLDKLLKIPHHICPCTLDDFGCTFGNYFVNGQCIKDLDENENKIFDMCVPGEFLIMPSKAKILEGDICKSTEEWTAPESDICKFTSQDNSISVLIGSTIKYAYVNGNGKQEFINLPIDLNNVGNIKSYCVNFRLRCLYVLNGTGIIQFCYNKKEFAYKNLEEIFLQDYSILGMRLDQTSNDIFYYGLKNISIINEISKYSKVLYISYYDISYLNLFQTLGIIVYAYTNIDLVPNKYCVNFLSMKGAQKSNLCYDVPINAVAHDAENKIYVIYLEGAVFKVDYNYDLVEKKAAVNKHILEAYVNGNQEYFIKKIGIFFGSNAFYNNHITHGHFHFVQKTYEKAPCILAHCDIFCLTTSSISYECDCPNNMVFNNILLKCICDASYPNCTACKSNEYHCENQKCVPLFNRCNKVDNCGDSSDEKNCDMTCEIDEILCDNDSKCVGYSDICDGIKNCDDGKDELNCHTVSKCNKNQYKCLNGDCIPESKYCDSIKDCPDYSDEESCQPGCKYFEARCKNGQCVMKNQICDYNFDCADLSDEHGCDSIFDVTRNISCLIRCDNKCIPHDKVCNHITDCSDGADELDCKNKAFCSSKNMLNCNSDIICYELFKKCDGFNDCLDGIDEANCEKTDLCSKSDIFECASMEKCISINDHCDGKYDCLDRSDEGQNCNIKKYIEAIRIKSMQDGNLELIWFPTKKDTKENYYVSVRDSKTNISFAEKIVTQRYILIKGLKNCNRYTAIVKIPGSNIWRSLQFTYKSAQAKSPKTIRYDYSRYLLHWSYYTEYCISSWFYIECLNRDRIVLQNFSTTNYIVVLYNSNLSCHVSVCPLNVFNISCSSFSDIIYLEVYSPHYKLKWACIILMSFIFIACILYFLLRKKKLLCCNFAFNCFPSRSLKPARIKMNINTTYIPET